MLKDDIFYSNMMSDLLIHFEKLLLDNTEGGDIDEVQEDSKHEVDSV